MSNIKEILRLQELGLSARQTARATGVSRTAVKNILRRAADAGLIFTAARELPECDLKALVYPPAKQADSSRRRYFERLVPEILASLTKPHQTMMYQWEVYHAAHPDGYSYSQFCFHLSQARSQEGEVSLHLEHHVGEKIFVDYAGDKLFIRNQQTGERESAEVFVAILPASHYTFMLATRSQRTEDWLPANELALRYFGGVPQVITPDCTKTAVTVPDRYESEINPQYRQFAEHYGTVIVPARPAHPNDKALVENAIRNLYRFIYVRLADREFHSLAELNAAIEPLLAQYNRRRMRAYGCSRQELFEQQERAMLKPLPMALFEYKAFQPERSVAYHCHLFLSADKHYYSVPVRHKPKKCSIFYTNSLVEIYCAGVRIATHQRDCRPFMFTTNPEHLPPSHREYLKWNPERLTAWALEIGEHTGALVRAMFNQAQHPFQAMPGALGLLALNKRYGYGRLEQACKRALRFDVCRFKKVENILLQGLDRLADEQGELDDCLPEHEHLRNRKSIIKEAI